MLIFIMKYMLCGYFRIKCKLCELFVKYKVLPSIGFGILRKMAKMCDRGKCPFGP